MRRWRVDEAVTRQAALDGFTRGAASAGFAEDRLGTLMPGMRADFILVDVDPLLGRPSEVRATRVAETWVGGGPVWVRGGEAAVARAEEALPEGETR